MSGVSAGPAASGASAGPAADGASARPAVQRAIIALGANLGDRDHTLRAAVADITSLSGVDLVGASGPVESVAFTLDGPDESKPSYLNGVVAVDTTLSPLELLDELGRIEDEHGRVRLERWGDRTLDLDLIVHGDAVIDTERLTLPHPRAAERSFVLEPWSQIDPSAILPGFGPLADLLAKVHDTVVQVAGAARLDAPLASAEPRASAAAHPSAPAKPGAIA